MTLDCPQKDCGGLLAPMLSRPGAYVCSVCGYKGTEQAINSRREALKLWLKAPASNVEITVSFTESEAESFALYLKRAGFSDYLAHASGKAQAYEMAYAGEAVRAALKLRGFNPR